jgi:hypothetical protein
MTPFPPKTPPIPPPASCPLRRFVTDGLRATLDAYTDGTLPIRRLAWELQQRLRSLDELTGLPHWRTLAALRTAVHTVATVDAAHHDTGRAELTATQHLSLTGALSSLRTSLSRLTPTEPAGPPAPPAPAPPAPPTTAHPPAPPVVPLPRPAGSGTDDAAAAGGADRRPPGTRPRHLYPVA